MQYVLTRSQHPNEKPTLHLMSSSLSMDCTLCGKRFYRVVKPNPSVVCDSNVCEKCLEGVSQEVAVYRVTMGDWSWISHDHLFVMGFIEALEVGDVFTVEVISMTIREYDATDASEV